MKHTYPETTYVQFKNGEASDIAILIGCPQYEEIAAAIEEIIGDGEVHAKHVYCAPYVPQTDYKLTFRSPADPARILEIDVSEDHRPSGDDPWNGLTTVVECPRDDEAFSVLVALAGIYGGWTRRSSKVENVVVLGLTATSETAGWTLHEGTGTASPAFKAEVALRKLRLDGRTLYGIMAYRYMLDSIIDVLTGYRSAIVDDIDRLPGSGERTRHEGYLPDEVKVALHNLRLDGRVLYGIMADRNALDGVIDILTSYRSATMDGVDRLPGSGERDREQKQLVHKVLLQNRVRCR